jgi:two-component system, sensor histidine kinase
MPQKMTPKVLIVDDTPANLVVMTSLLEDKDCQLITTASGEEALSKVMDHDFAVILMDVQMPGMDGFEAAELIRGVEKSKDVPIIFVTALSKERNYIFKGYELGAVDFLFKPLDSDILKSKVNVFLRLNRQRRELEDEVARRKATELELENAKREADSANQAKSDFLGNMSHEIRTPMNAVLGYAQILQRKNLEADDKKSVDHILSSGNHLLTLINDILDISKIEAGKVEVLLDDFDLTQMIHFLIGMFNPKCQEKGLAFKVAGVVEDAVWVNGDETKIRQILINLLGNAVKFTESGVVGLNISVADNDQYQFDVTDTGKGIPAEAQKSIFDPFQQDSEGREKGGTGLGLAIAQAQAQAMDGQLALISELGKGSQFSLSLKLPPGVNVPARENGITDKKVTRLAPGYEVKALVVDDVALNRDVLTKTLTEVGILVLTAENGKDAVEMVQEFAPDIVFMDNRMPVMDGTEATRIIKNKYSSDQIKVVTITAGVLKHQRKLIAESDADGFISKPFQTEKLFECIKELLKIEFEYEEEGKSKCSEIDLSKISISENLYESLKNAAELYQISELEKIIKELKKESPDGKALAEYFEPLYARYDIKNISKALEKVQHGHQ